MTVQELAHEAYEFFNKAPRNDGSDYWFLDPDAPDWVRVVTYAAHGDFLPDDWRYEFIVDAIGTIAYSAADADLDDAFLEPDIYTNRLTAWLASNINRVAYCDEAAEDYGTSSTSVVTLIGLGQIREQEEVYASVLASLREELEAREEDDEECAE